MTEKGHSLQEMIGAQSISMQVGLIDRTRFEAGMRVIPENQKKSLPRNIGRFKKVVRGFASYTLESSSLMPSGCSIGRRCSGIEKKENLD